MFVHRLSLVTVFGLASISLASAASPVPGHVIVARASGDALVIWDATEEVASIVKDKVADGAAKTRLERDALLQVIAEQAKIPAATSIAVRVIYSKSGDVSPVYGSPTFAGVERYATITLKAADIKSDRDKWKEAASSAAPLPGWVAFEVVGELPPR